MKTIRKGNDIVVRWRIFRYGQEYDIALYRESISLVLSNMGEKKEITDYTIVDVNTIVFKYRAEDQGLGIYRLLLIDKSRNSTRIIEECNAFRLVNTSDAANNDGTLESAITITLTSELTAPADGLSAYEVALQNGFIGTEEEWLQSLKGEQGPQGIQGDKGDKGDRGEQGDKGLSAYQVAIANGFVGTEAEWLQSLVPDTTDIELAEAQRQAKELERIEAENARQSAELERQNASTEAVASANEAASSANNAASSANNAASSANAVVAEFKSIIVQETGAAQDKVMSQKAVTDAMTASQAKLSELEGKINGGESEQDLTDGFVVGYFNGSGVLMTSATNWRCLSVNVSGGEKFKIKLKGTNNSGHADFVSIGYFVGTTFTKVKSVSEFVDYEDTYTLPADATKVVFTTLFNNPDIVYYVKKLIKEDGIVSQIKKEEDRAKGAEQAIANDVNSIKSLLKEEKDLFKSPQVGYFKKDGTWQGASANWLSTGKIAVKEGDSLNYVAVGNNIISCYGYWDNIGNYHDVSLPSGEVTITDGMTAIQVSSKAQSGDVYHAVLKMSKELVTEDKLDVVKEEIKNELKGAAERKVSFFVPQSVNIVRGNDFRIYPYNAISVNEGELSLDCWIENTQSSNSTMVSCEDGMFIRGKGNVGIIDHNGVALTWKLRNYNGEITTIGTSTIVAKTPVNPSSKLYVLPIGDSVTEFPSEGVQEEGFVGGNGKGAWVNEFSRMLNGVGDAIPNGGDNGTLANVEVIGTRGNGTVKHEGRAGWAINNYLTNASVGDVTNAFWNPATSSFDLQYYLQSNGFTGVVSDGSNLVIIIFLNWNNVYSMTSEQFKDKYNEFLTKIHAQLPQARVMILGLNCPPNKMNKTYRGNRIVTRLGVIEQCIRVENVLKEIADGNSTFVTHCPLLPFFCADGSYPTIAQKKNLRLSSTNDYYSDYVHPNLVGYGQIADIVYNTFCVRYL